MSGGVDRQLVTAGFAGIAGSGGGDADEIIDAALALLSEARESPAGAWIEPQALVERLRALVADAEDPVAGLRGLRPGDITWASAVLAGHPDACAALESEIHAVAAAAVGRMGGAADEATETAREVVEKVVAGGAGRGPRIADYAGRGSLAAWLRATVSRTYLNRIRSRKREVLIGDQAVLAAFDDDHRGSPGDRALDHFKDLYRAEFAEAFESAIATLTDRQRAILRYRFVDGATVETIAAVYRVHRATCHRWIGEARAALAEGTERLLRSKLALTESDFDRVRALVESQLELSLSRIFATRS